MALTKISTDGVKDDAITKTKIPANQIEASELADNAVDTNAIADDAVTDAKLANSINSAIAANTAKVQTTINNNADNRVITGSGTANTLEGEANLTFSGGATGDATLTVHAEENNNASEAFLKLETSNDFAESVVTAHDSSGVGGSLKYNHGDNAWRFTTNGDSERMRIDSSGNVGLGVTSVSDARFRIKGANNTTSAFNDGLMVTSNNETVYKKYSWMGIEAKGGILFSETNSGSLVETMRIQSGGGISFNGDTAAANALDDYEEGTWTPSVTMSGGDQGLGYEFRYGTYTKIGRKVYVEAYVKLNAISSNGTGYMKLVGFPFNSNTGNVSYGGMHCPYYNSMNNQVMRGALIERNDNFAYIYYDFEGSAAGGTIQNATVAALFTTTSQFVLIGSYQTP